MATDDNSGSNNAAAATAPESAGEAADLASSSAESGPLELNLAVRSDLDNPEAFGNAVDAGGGGDVDQSSDTGLRELPYDPDRARDATRQIIALWLLGLLCSIVVLVFVALFARGAASGFRAKEFFGELKQVLDVIVGPTITLLASAIGFYFGSKQGEQNVAAKK